MCVYIYCTYTHCADILNNKVRDILKSHRTIKNIEHVHVRMGMVGIYLFTSKINIIYPAKKIISILVTKGSGVKHFYVIKAYFHSTTIHRQLLINSRGWHKK